MVEHQNVEAEEQEDKIGAHDITTASAIADATSVTGAGSLSKTKNDDGEVGEGDEKKPDIDKGVMMRAFRMNRGEWFFMILGMAGAAVAGASFPGMAVAFAEVINTTIPPRVNGITPAY